MAGGGALSASIDIAQGTNYWWANPVAAKQRAVAPCGCAVYVGIRTDRDPPEAASAGMACTPEHDWLIAEFNEILTASLLVPTDKSLVTVCGEILGDLYDEKVGDAGDEGQEEVQEVRADPVEDDDAA